MLQVQVVWIYVGRALEWERALPDDVKKLVVPIGDDAQDPSKTIQIGAWVWINTQPGFLGLVNRHANGQSLFIGQQHECELMPARVCRAVKRFSELSNL